jgi:hypothetical protein
MPSGADALAGYPVGRPKTSGDDDRPAAADAAVGVADADAAAWDVLALAVHGLPMVLGSLVESSLSVRRCVWTRGLTGMAMAAVDGDVNPAHGSADVRRCCGGDMAIAIASAVRGDGGIMAAGPSF